MTRWGSRRGGPGREQGSATVLAVVMIGVLASVAVLGVAVAGLVVGQRRADAAADLAALAGAAAHQRGDAACAAAGRIAAANLTEVVECAVTGEDVTVAVVARVDSLFERTWELSGRARAGPAS